MHQNNDGKTRFDFTSQPVQQPGYERTFNTIFQVDKKSQVQVVKDLSNTLPVEPFKATPQVGAMLQDWCYKGEPIVSPQIQHKIDACESLAELYQLLFDLDIEEGELFQAFTKRRLELDNRQLEGSSRPAQPPLDVIQGGGNE